MEDISYRSTVKNKQNSELNYMLVSLEFEPDASEDDMDIVSLKNLIIQALKALFGNLGASLQVDVLRFDEKTKEAILRVEGSGLVQLWSALTWCGSYKHRKYSFHIHKISSCLLSLSTNSRTFVHKPVQIET